MPVEIEILDKVITRLQTVVKPALGYLYGISYEGKILIVGFSFDDPPLIREYSDTSVSTRSRKDLTSDEEEGLASAFMSATGLGSKSTMPSTTRSDLLSSSESSSSKTLYFDALQAIYPTGIDVVGALGIKNGVTFEEQEIKQKLKDVYVTNTPPYLEKDSEKDELMLKMLRDGVFHLKHFRILTSDELKANFCVVNLLANISVKLPVRPQPTARKFPQIQQLAKRVSEEMMFRVGKSDIFLSLSSIFHNLYASIGKLFNKAIKEKDYRTGLEVVKVYGFFPSVVDVDVESEIFAPFIIDYESSSITDSSEQIVAFDEASEKFCIDVQIPFDGLCIVHRNRSIRDAYSILIDAAERIIYLAEIYINKLTAYDDAFAIQTLTVHHFLPEDLGHPVSLIYIHDDTDEELEEVRRGLHNSFNLSLEKPIFRKGLSLCFTDTIPIPLIDVHIGVRPSGLKGPNRKMALVKGSYEYYHYNLRKSKSEEPDIKDSQWGCAYRSLQTICSWFKLQGYTSLDVPTHRRVQEILVEIGDKSQTFVGTKSWIGSTEVSYALETYLSNVSSIIVNLSSGAEMYTMGPVLYDHFRFQGTPVMIGGGSLAHTILGVDYDEETSEIYFLVLDPHYIGEEDAAYIQKKSFIAWKGLDFWAKSSFYNLCLPQRPICF